jgi:hypothetical protein
VTFEEAFEMFWKAYPTQGRGKGARKPALERFLRLMKDRPREKRKALLDAIMGGLERYGDYLKEHEEFNKDASAWLNQHGWEDDYGITNEADKPTYVSPEQKAEIVRWKIKHGLMHMKDIGWLESYEQKKRDPDIASEAP